MCFFYKKLNFFRYVKEHEDSKMLSRLSSFKDFCNSDRDLNLSKLANNGFKFNDGHIVCYACGAIFDNLKRTDDPIKLHKKLSPQCPVANGNTEHIVLPNDIDAGFDEETSEDEHRHTPGASAAIGSNLSAVVQSVYHRHAAQQQRANTQTSTVQPSVPPMPVLPYKVKFPQYIEKSIRLESFEGKWIYNYRLCNPEHLSEAGFFYMGPEDTVKCFCCGCGLNHFQQEDDPWKEHAKYYPRCIFLTLHKDGAFINSVRPQPLQQVPPTRRPTILHTISLGPGPYRVDGRDLKSRMEFPIVKILLDRGYERELIRQALESRLSHYGDDFPGVVALLEAVTELEEYNRDRGNCVLASTMELAHYVSTSPASAEPPQPSIMDVIARAATTEQTTQATLPTQREENFSVVSEPAPTPVVPEPRVPAPIPASAASAASASASAASAASASSTKNKKKKKKRTDTAANVIGAVATIGVAVAMGATAPIGLVAAAAVAGGMSALALGYVEEKMKATSVATPATSATPATPVATPATSATPATPVATPATSATPATPVATPATSATSALEDSQNDPEVQLLLEENGQLREARTCKVCLDKEVDTVFLPCGHLVCCRTCAPELRTCPVCRTLIRGTVLIVLT